MDNDEAEDRREKAYQFAITIALLVSLLPLISFIYLIPSLRLYGFNFYNDPLSNDLRFCEVSLFDELYL